MKYFTREYALGNLPPDECVSIQALYKQHIDSLLPKLSAAMQKLAKNIVLERSHFLCVDLDRAGSILKVDVLKAPVNPDTTGIRLIYYGVAFDIQEIVELASSVRNRNTMILCSEIDLNQYNNYIHRMLLYPQRELTFTFESLEIEELPHLNDEALSQIGDPFKVFQGTHPDGTICLEGTQKIPENFNACCDVFESHTTSCVHDVRYEWWDNSKQWVISLSELSGGDGITIAYCPHCGQKLKPIFKEYKMGTWGYKSFENDDAMDWVHELEISTDLSVIVAALDTVIEGADDYIEFVESANAIAAVEVVAALNGQPAPSLPEEVVEWVKGKPKADASVIAKAHRALNLVLAESELKELWEESPENYLQWLNVINDLRSRLVD